MDWNHVEQDLPRATPPRPLPHPLTFRLPAGSIDCHLHLFGDPVRYPLAADRTYDPAPVGLSEALEMHHALGASHGVLIQPSVYGYDNRLLCDSLQSCRERGLDYRGVAVVTPDISDAELERLSELGVCGVRLNLIFAGGLRWRDVVLLADRLARFKWHLECLIDVSTFRDMEARLGSLPVPVVIDHMGHLAATRGPECPGFAALCRLLKQGRTWVKLSAPYRLTTRGRLPYSDVTALVRALVAANPERVVWGSDWPHPYIGVEMPEEDTLAELMQRWLPEREMRERIFRDNPRKLYGYKAFVKSRADTAH
ncbi:MULTISPECIES: amidohydrolase [unclassified Cobetia]|uniref:amidohydrolase family protein n=1 Tax=unclassified Cobetia TaxID=2609414 RepID=UPI00159E0C9C|nr:MULTISPECIES: amidohydrolase family protein [unclassified Cobetia]MCO7231978.1 amidohydrolase family protein [Cobetia sp. Dlab-2-AX]MCO7235646.1 amidohydrolase family protein [Cobetia sp. Dlab-2-U]NVN54784.1 amidohydrolase family protein [bacterium Scap17]